MPQKKKSNSSKLQGFSFNNPQNQLLIRQSSFLQSQLSQEEQYNPQKIQKELFQFNLKEKNLSQNFAFIPYQNYKISLQYHDQMINCIIRDKNEKQYQTLIKSSMKEFEIFKSQQFKVKQLYDQLKDFQHAKQNNQNILVTKNKNLKIKITRSSSNRKKLSIEAEFKTWKVTCNRINQIQKKLKEIDRKVNQNIYGKEQTQLLWQNHKQIKDKVMLKNLQTPQDQQFIINQNKLIVQIGHLNNTKNYSLSLVIRNKDYEQFQTIITEEMSQFQELRKCLYDVQQLYDAMKIYLKLEVNDSVSQQNSLLILQIDNKYNINIIWKEKRPFKEELLTYKGYFQTFKISQTRMDRLEKKVKNLEKQNYLLKRKMLQEYFDKSHPHFSKFSLMNKNIIVANYLPSNAWYQITSPNKISETFTSFSYKVIKTSSNYIMYGIGSNALNNNQKNQNNNNDFIGYQGYNNGYVYDQKQKGAHLNINGGTITRNDTIRVSVNLKAREVSWYKNGNTKLYTSQISQTLANKDLYPVLIMYHNEDTVQMNYQ